MIDVLPWYHFVNTPDNRKLGLGLYPPHQKKVHPGEGNQNHISVRFKEIQAQAKNLKDSTSFPRVALF